MGGGILGGGVSLVLAFLYSVRMWYNILLTASLPCSVNGRQLLDFLVHKATVNEKLVADLMRQLFDGLEYMHSHTVYHLDIRVSVCLSHQCLFVCPVKRLFVLPNVCLSCQMSVCLSCQMSVCLSCQMSVCPVKCLFVCLLG